MPRLRATLSSCESVGRLTGMASSLEHHACTLDACTIADRVYAPLGLGGIRIPSTPPLSRSEGLTPTFHRTGRGTADYRSACRTGHQRRGLRSGNLDTCAWCVAHVKACTGNYGNAQAIVYTLLLF